jgi:hypothetical protein
LQQGIPDRDKPEEGKSFSRKDAKAAKNSENK